METGNHSEHPSARVVGFASDPVRKQTGVAFARERRIPLLGSDVLRAENAWPADLEADRLVNINGSVIVAPHVLDRFDGRALNMHPGPLPEYAGLHVHQWAIRNGEARHGATIHVMEAGVDTGPIVDMVRFPIVEADTGLSLFKRTMDLGTKLLIHVLEGVIKGTPPASRPQDLARRHYYRHDDALDGTIVWE